MTKMEGQPPLAREGQRIVRGPSRLRSERWWEIELEDGRRCVLAQLLPELALDEALRRRYVYDAERRASLDLPGVAKVIEVGPSPDPRDPNAAAPWRLRELPSGELLSSILDARSPLPPDEAIELVAAISDIVSAVHGSGAVCRDLEPRNIVVAPSSVALTDIGLARVDVLSSRTASSLMLESSPYSAPEQLRATVLDSRADLYTLGVILWRALTGELPFTDQIAFFRDTAPLPALADLGIDVGPGLDRLIASCLSDDPDRRPDTARDLADALRGKADPDDVGAGQFALALVVCQSCGERLRPGLRLCLACGNEAVQFSHANGGLFEVQLIKAEENTEFLAKLGSFFEAVSEGPIPELNFLIGDARLYSKSERARLHKLPATLINNLDKSTADRLAERLTAEGFKVKVVSSRRGKRPKKVRLLVYGGLLTALFGGGFLGAGMIAAGAVMVALGGVSMITGAVRYARRPREPGLALTGLRSAPAALPASDPLVARLGTLLGSDLAEDARARVEETALLVQRMVDHRGRSESANLERLIEPIEPIVGLVEREIRAISSCDAMLSQHDEGLLVRAIASSEARRESRQNRIELYAGLDKLRELEDQRALHMDRLLEASSLMRRVVNLGLGAKSDEDDARRLNAMALATLETP